MDIGRSRLFAIAAVIFALASAVIAVREYQAGDPAIDWMFNIAVTIFLITSASAHWRKRTPR